MVNKNNPDISFWKNKNVLITGHNGFKGSWLSLWLLKMGAKVSGVSLKPSDKINLYDNLCISSEINEYICDITNSNLFEEIVLRIKPDIVFHMAAQPLVKKSYKEPKYTWEVNVIGTINLLESLRKLNNKCIAIFITTDKVYKNVNLKYAFREEDALGGFDPYSSSKASCELAITAWRNSFLNFSEHQQNIMISSVRSGNVIGGGDWSEDRIVPDLIRSILSNRPLNIRNPNSVRPWQHVLDPLSGYILLAEKYSDEKVNQKELYALNFGPLISSNQTVSSLVNKAFSIWKGSWIDSTSVNEFYESDDLRLSIDKSFRVLGWQPRWDFDKTLEKTISWYKSFYKDPSKARWYCENDIEQFLI